MATGDLSPDEAETAASVVELLRRAANPNESENINFIIIRAGIERTTNGCVREF